MDVVAAERRGWDIAGPEAYPSATRLDRGLALRVPLPWELELLTGVLRAVPEFVEHLTAGTKPDEESRTTHVGRLTVTITGLHAD